MFSTWFSCHVNTGSSAWSSPGREATSGHPDIRTSSTFGHPALLDIQYFWHPDFCQRHQKSQLGNCTGQSGSFSLWDKPPENMNKCARMQGCISRSATVQECYYQYFCMNPGIQEEKQHVHILTSGHPQIWTSWHQKTRHKNIWTFGHQSTCVSQMLLC